MSDFVHLDFVVPATQPLPTTKHTSRVQREVTANLVALQFPSANVSSESQLTEANSAPATTPRLVGFMATCPLLGYGLCQFQLPAEAVLALSGMALLILQRVLGK